MNPAYKALAWKLLRVFLFAAGATLATTLTGLASAPDLKLDRALVTSLIVGAIAAGAKAVQATLNENEAPGVGRGI